MSDLKLAFFPPCWQEEGGVVGWWGGALDLAVSTNGNFKQRSHTLFVLYGWSVCSSQGPCSEGPSGTVLCSTSPVPASALWARPSPSARAHPPELAWLWQRRG